MKITLIILLILLFINFSIFSETVSSNELIDTIENISNDVGPALSFAAASSGNNWDDAYIGTYPHFGIGGSFSLVLIPADSVDNLYNLFGISRPGDLDVVDFMPLFLASFDARTGTPIPRLDMGFKIGYIGHNPDNENEFNKNHTDVLIDYALAGFDIRYALVEQTLILPDISFGVGFNYYKTDIRIQMEENDYNNGETLLDLGDSQIDLGYPDLGFALESFSVDFKGQISKTFFFFTPFAGAGASYGTSKVAGVMYSDTENGTQNLSDYETALKTAGYEVENNKIYHEREYKGWSTRVFCGAGFGFSVLKVNGQVSYNLETDAVAFTLNGRIQF